jgi:hypothetical protein
MSYITRYGSFWGMIPVTSGRVFWVAPAASYTVEGRSYIGSDGNDGLSPERAFLTLDYAVGQCTANVGDVIVLLPGAHSYTATVAVDVAGITITGIPRATTTGNSTRGATALRHVTTITSTANILTVSVANVEIAYLHFIPAAALAGIVLSNTAAVAVNVHDVTFNMTTAADTATFGISATAVADQFRLSNFHAYVSDNQGPLVRTAAGFTNSIIENGTVVLDGTTAWDSVIEITTGTDQLVIRDCDFIHSSGALMTSIIDVTGNTSDHAVMVMRCMHGVGSVLTTATATSDIVLCNNYISTIRGGTGGTLSTG